MKSQYVYECWTFLHCFICILILCNGDDKIKKNETISDLWETLLKNASLLNFPTYNETEVFFQKSMKLYPHLITRFPIGVSYENRTLFGYRLHNMTENSKCVLKQSSLSDLKENIFNVKLKKCQVPLFSNSKSLSMGSLIDRLQNTNAIQTNYRRECPRILLTALHHAREPLSLTTLLYFMQKLIYTAEHEKTGNDLPRYLLQYRDIILIPFVNPDGYITIEKSRYFSKRKNARPTCPTIPQFSGVDLNRNYGYRFEKNGNICDQEDYSGEAPFSEPETQAVLCLLQTLTFLTAINFHSYGNFWFQPFNCCRNKKLHPLIARVYGDIAKSIGLENFHSSHEIETFNYETSGEAEDWMLHSFGIIAMSAEIGSEKNGFWPSAERIPLDSSVNYKAILSVAMKTGVEYEVLLSHTPLSVINQRLTLRNNGIAPVAYETVNVIIYKQLKHTSKNLRESLFFLSNVHLPIQETKLLANVSLRENDLSNAVICVMNSMEMSSRQFCYCHCGKIQLGKKFQLTPLMSTHSWCKDALVFLPSQHLRKLVLTRDWIRPSFCLFILCFQLTFTAVLILQCALYKKSS